MIEKTWLAKKSFLFIVFLCPTFLLYIAFLQMVPKEMLQSKPTPIQFVLGITVAILIWIIFVAIFSMIWAFFLRLVYGPAQVLKWINEEENNSGPLANFIVRSFRKICAIKM